MDAVRQWAFSLCAAMVACGIARQLLPKSNLESLFKLVVSVFFLCCLLSPIILQFPHARLELEEYSEGLIEEKTRRLQGVVEEQTQAAARRNAEKIIAEKLLQMGIKYHRMTININTNGQSETADSVDITLDSVHEPDHGKIATRLEAALGMDVRLEYESADGEG